MQFWSIVWSAPHRISASVLEEVEQAVLFKVVGIARMTSMKYPH